MRVRPRAWIGVVAFLGYGAVVVTAQALSGVRYPDLAGSAGALVRFGIVPLLLGAMYVVVLVTVLGWWPLVLRDRRRSAHRWPIVAPAGMAVVVLVTALTTRWARLDPSYVGTLLAVGILVGFCEETITRGVLLTALRSRVGEVSVWILTSVLFGALHVANLITGSSLAAVLPQILNAVAVGSALYISRRVTGSLVPAMVLHGSYDLSVLAATATSSGLLIANLLELLVALLAVAVGFWATRGPSNREPAAS